MRLPVRRRISLWRANLCRRSFVPVALAAFPELAKKARAWIDGKVKAASDAVNRAADCRTILR